MGPGPEGGGPKNNISRPHWPKRSGMREPPSAAIAGETNAAAEKTNAIVLAENRRGERTGIPDMSPSLVEAVIIQHTACGEVQNSCAAKLMCAWHQSLVPSNS